MRAEESARIEPLLSTVMRVPGLDPGIAPIRPKLRSSLPGLARQSIDLRKNLLAKKMDARVKPAHDEFTMQLKFSAHGA
jgi:hypothetical protein